MATTGKELKFPSFSSEVQWESLPPGKKLGSKTPKKATGFVVTPLQSQERLASSLSATLKGGET
jgi:hypothetical protein